MRSRRRRRTTREFFSEGRGSTVVEFALVAPVFIALVFAVLVTCVVYFSQEALETVADASARSVITGRAQTLALTAEEFTTNACSRLPDYMNCSRLSADVVSAHSLAEVDTTPLPFKMKPGTKKSSNARFALGKPGDITVVRLLYVWPASVSALSFSFSNLESGERLLVATRVAKVEPYPQ